MPYGITQCYPPPGRDVNPAQPKQVLYLATRRLHAKTPAHTTLKQANVKYRHWPNAKWWRPRKQLDNQATPGSSHKTKFFTRWCHFTVTYTN